MRITLPAAEISTEPPTLDPHRLEDVISSLENYEDEFRAEHVVPGTVVLLNLLYELPERPRGMFDLDSRLVVGRVTYRLLRSLDSPEDVGLRLGRSSRSSRSSLPSSKWSPTLVTKKALVTSWSLRRTLLSSSEHGVPKFVRHLWMILWGDPDLLRVLLVAMRYAEADEPPVDLASSPELTLAVLHAARSEVRSQYAGSRAVRRSFRLAWDALVEIFGSEDMLRTRVEALKDTDLQVEEGLLEEVDKYLSGWRPEED